MSCRQALCSHLHFNLPNHSSSVCRTSPSLPFPSHTSHLAHFSYKSGFIKPFLNSTPCPEQYFIIYNQSALISVLQRNIHSKINGNQFTQSQSSEVQKMCHMPSSQFTSVDRRSRVSDVHSQQISSSAQKEIKSTLTSLFCPHQVSTSCQYPLHERWWSSLFVQLGQMVTTSGNIQGHSQK